MVTNVNWPSILVAKITSASRPAALAALKRFQLGPQVSGLSVTQLDGYKCQLALNSGRQNHFCVAARIPRVDLFDHREHIRFSNVDLDGHGIPQSPTEGNYTRPA